MDNRDRKRRLHAWRDQERANARAKLPLPPNELRALFDMLDIELPQKGCDHSRRLTNCWLRSRGLNVELVFAWLDENGGFCDCEVLANSEQYFDDAMHGAD